MSLKLKDIVGDIFHTDAKEKAEKAQKTTALQQKLSNVLGMDERPTANTHNPFLKKNGDLFNPLLNYQSLLDNPGISKRVKNYITQATGLTQKASEVSASPTLPVEPQTPVAAPTNPVQPSDVTSNNNLVNAAKNYIGTPYVWGGESMSEGGMDCSGFVYNALKDAGYNVGRTTAQGYRGYGTKVDSSDMKAGDLLFFGDGKATHVGIYIGNGQMIHSSGNDTNTASNPGKGVEIKNIDYRKDFLEARRY